MKGNVNVVMSSKIVEVRKKVLSKNDELAGELRTRLRAAHVFTLNLVSSPGTGKTEFLQKTLRALLAAGYRVAALVGDLETDNDARRLAESGAPVRQIMTHGCCHLEAQLVASNLEGWDLNELDFLFIENVGNLVCPANYDLGEDVRVALLSVTEGEDKTAQVSFDVPLFERRGDHEDGFGGALRGSTAK